MILSCPNLRSNFLEFIASLELNTYPRFDCLINNLDRLPIIWDNSGNLKLHGCMFKFKHAAKAL